MNQKNLIKFKIWSLLTWTMICLLEGSLVVILILGFTFPKSLIMLCISLIFFDDKLEKLSLSFRIFLTLEAEVWVYECLLLMLESSLEGLCRIEGGTFTTSTYFLLLFVLTLLLGLLFIIFEVNLNMTFCLNVLLLLLALSKFHPAS